MFQGHETLGSCLCLDIDVGFRFDRGYGYCCDGRKLERSRNRIRRRVVDVSRSEIESRSVEIMQDLESVLNECPETTTHKIDKLRDAFKTLWRKINNQEDDSNGSTVS